VQRKKERRRGGGGYEGGFERKKSEIRDMEEERRSLIRLKELSRVALRSS
jgi:hypothetical protein